MTRASVLDWVVVGGGPHGVCAARALAAQGASLRIVDPSGELLQRWTRRAEAVAMTWMRSPAGHHLDDAPVSLHHFLHRPENADVDDLAGIWRRPTHAAFLRHSREVIERDRLNDLVVRARVEGIRRDGSHLVVLGGDVELRAKRVLVATGSNVPRMPEWARPLEREGAPVRHVFGDDVALDRDLLGGGISAVQRALMIQRDTDRTVRIWMRRAPTVADFDVDRDWTKHRFAMEWSELDDAQRLDFLDRHPTRGSVPQGLATRLDRAERRGSIEVTRGEPTVEWNASREELEIRTAHGSVASLGLTLATGLEPERVDGWLAATADRLELPRVGGLPRLGDDMEWGHGVHVSGPLARLRLGPMAGNLAGARWATSKLPGVRMQPL